MSGIGVLGWVGIVMGATVAAVILGMLYLAIVLAWEDQRTRGAAYYGLPRPERERFRARLRLHARLLYPILRLTAGFTRVTLPKASFRYEGVAGPKGTCSPESFQAGRGYAPRPEDVFVVTQMKCGTTWMQHVVYQVLTRGRGALASDGRALYAISPWLEGVRSVRMDDAPLVGEERPSRIIKTHFPAELCPFELQARYVYVVRHPVSCFASCADFIAENLGVFSPSLDAIRDWFCSDETMWWGSWPRHVEGWWQRATGHDNVLFVRFEDMKRDLAGITVRVAAFLGVTPLEADELAAVVEHCGFEYMSEHATSFEMHPPHLLAIDAQLFVRGTADRYRDVPDAMREDIMSWCRERTAGGAFPLPTEYPRA